MKRISNLRKKHIGEKKQIKSTKKRKKYYYHKQQ